MRKPKIENKYNLTIPKIKKLIVADRSKVCTPLFWRNDVISAWCICKSAGTERDHNLGTDTAYWIGIYDEDAKAYAGKFRFNFSSWGGMCDYKFTKFFDPSEIEYETDLEVQELFLEKINELIDLGILAIGE